MADTKGIKVDFSDKKLTLPKGKVSKLDPTQDSFALPKPAPAGVYALKFAYSKEGMQYFPLDPDQEVSEDNVYYSANLELNIADNEEWAKQKVFTVVNTKLTRGRELSTMADMIIRLGAGKYLKESMSDFEVAELFDKVMQKEPTLKGVTCDWEGYSKLDEKTVFRAMTDFPEDGKGSHNHVVTYTNSKRLKEEITAQLRVKKWPAKGEVSTAKQEKKPPKVVVPPKVVEKPKEETVEQVEEDTIDLLS